MIVESTLGNSKVYRCSKCNEVLIHSLFLTKEKFWKYCPYCGEELSWKNLEVKNGSL